MLQNSNKKPLQSDKNPLLVNNTRILIINYFQY